MKDYGELHHAGDLELDAKIKAAIELLQDQDYTVIPKERLLVLRMSSLMEKFDQSVIPFDKVLELTRHQHATALAVDIMHHPDLTLEITTEADQRVRLTTKLGFIKPKKEIEDGHAK